MRFTQYFLAIRNRPDRSVIRDEWIQFVIANPIKQVVQSDGRIRRWARIADMGDRVLRVVLLEDGITIHNAFFDRSFKE